MSYRPETIAIHGGQEIDPITRSRAVPIHRTTSYVFKDSAQAANLFALKELGNIYTRLQNPTTDVLEKRVSLLEGAHEMAGLALASGTSAVFYSIINLAKAGDNIVSGKNIYGGTFVQLNSILPDLGITTKFVDSNNLDEVAAAIDDKTRAIFVETLSNPALEIADLEALSNLAHEHGIPLIADATLTTSFLSRPMDFGADIVVHSLTKYIGGHGTGIGGAIVDSGRFNWAAGKHPLYDAPDASYHGLRWGHDLPEALAPLAYILRARTVPLRNLGACIAPDNSWLFLQGLETLPLRMERHCANAQVVAEFLNEHPLVEWVSYPGLASHPHHHLNQKYLSGKGGPSVVFGIKGGKTAGQKFVESAKLFSHLVNLGDAKSLVVHPATTTHSQLSEEQQLAGGIRPELVRLCIGLEHIEDILEDLDQALKQATQA